MINKIFALPVIEQLTPVLSRRQLDDLDLIVVDHPQVKASLHYRARTFSPGNPLARKRYYGSVIIRLSKPAWRYAAVYRSAGPGLDLRLNRVCRHTALRVIFRGR